MNKTLTVFTPSYNRKHTIVRTFESLMRQTSEDLDWLIVDDGSSDGTRQWVEGLGEKVIAKGQKFDWMGRPLDGDTEDHFVVMARRETGSPLRIEYIYKPNGGLYTGYNTAYATIQTELCVCIDSDDFMPDDAVEKTVKLWRERGSDKYAGIEGLDFDINTAQPIGGYFPADLTEVYLHDMHLQKLHAGDTKQVMRTALMKEVAPMTGFSGEKNFNPIYLLLQVCDRYPLLVFNGNLCTVEYQVGADSMSQGIFRQYVNSPRSFAKMRQLEMTLVHNTPRDRFRSAIHYVSSCLIAADSKWLSSSPRKGLTLLAAPFGLCLYLLIMYKNRKS